MKSFLYCKSKKKEKKKIRNSGERGPVTCVKPWGNYLLPEVPDGKYLHLLQRFVDFLKSRCRSAGEGHNRLEGGGEGHKRQEKTKKKKKKEKKEKKKKKKKKRNRTGKERIMKGKEDAYKMTMITR